MSNAGSNSDSPLSGFLVLSGPVYAQQKRAISVGTGGTGGVCYPYGGAVASVITKYIPNVEATA